MESQTALESEKNYTKPRRTKNIFGVFDFKTKQGRSKQKGKYFLDFWIVTRKSKRQSKTTARKEKQK